MPRVERCAGAVVLDRSGRLLLVQRANPPGAGQWTIPGGRCEAGESPEAACVREVAEETGLRVSVRRFLDRVDRPGADGAVYDITDFECEVTGGVLAAGDDAADARWVTRSEFERLPLVDRLAEFLAEHGVLPA